MQKSTFSLEKKYQELKRKTSFVQINFEYMKFFHGEETDFFFGWSEDELVWLGSRIETEIESRNSVY